MPHIPRARVLATLALIGTIAACGSSQNPEWELPDATAVVDWFGPGTQGKLDGNVLEIRGSMDPEYLKRGGRIWARSGPYFYLFNVHVRQLLRDYPDLAAVRAVTLDERGEEVARAMLTRSELSEGRWNEALARASLAQQQGTDNPRLLERLITFGEDHTEFRYRAD